MPGGNQQDFSYKVTPACDISKKDGQEFSTGVDKSGIHLKYKTESESNKKDCENPNCKDSGTYGSNKGQTSNNSRNA